MSNSFPCPALTGLQGRPGLQARPFSNALIVLSFLLFAWAIHAEGPDSEYLPIFNLIQDADALEAKGQTNQALAKFQEAQRRLLAFKRTYPDWNVKMMSFRTKYLADRVAALSAPPPAAAGTNESAEPKPDTKPSSGTQVKLQDPGAEPRQVLRLQPKPGDKQSSVMTMKVGVETKIGEMDAPAMQLPVMKVTVDTTVTSVSPEGEINYDLLVSDAVIADETGAVAQIVEAMKSVMAALKGMTGKGVMTSRGIGKSLQLKATAGVDPQMQQMVEQMRESFSQMPQPLPEEAVGAGAKWEVRMPLKSEGITIDQTSLYHLAALEGEKGTAKVTVSQRAANQKITNPAMPTMKIDLTKLTGKGKGEFTFELGRLLPTSSNFEYQSERLMAMNVGGQKQEMTVKADAKVQVEPK